MSDDRTAAPLFFYMYITTQEQDGVVVINVVGVLDIESHLALKAKFRELVCDEGCRKILIDVSGIKEVDSAGIGVLISLVNTVRKRNGDLRLAGVSSQMVEEAFGLCLLSNVLQRYPNVEQGVRNFNC